MIMLLRQFTLHFVYELPIVTNYYALIFAMNEIPLNSLKLIFFVPCFIIKMTSL